MRPVTVTVNGTGVSTPVVGDIFQNPFNVGIGIEANTTIVGTTSGTSAIIGWQVEHTFDWLTVMSPTWNGSTNVVWIPNSGLNATALASSTPANFANGNYAFPVAAVRLNVFNTVANSSVSMVYIQASESP